MNIEELFDDEMYHNYGMLTTDDANCLINYLKSEVKDYIIKMKEALDASHEAELDAAAERFWKRIAELEARNKELMCAMREWYEDGFNRGDCGELIVKHGGEA